MDILYTMMNSAPTLARMRRTTSSGKRMRFSKVPPHSSVRSLPALGQELVQQIAFGTHHFHAIVAGHFCVTRCVGKAVYFLFNFIRCQSTRRERKNWRLLG